MALDPSTGDEPSFQKIVAVLDDSGCRAILAILDEPLTVPEIADRAGLALSSTYRKLDRLTGAGLVTETVGIQHGRHHKSRYVVDFDRLSIDLDDDLEFQVDVGRPTHNPFDVWATHNRDP